MAYQNGWKVLLYALLLVNRQADSSIRTFSASGFGQHRKFVAFALPIIVTSPSVLDCFEECRLFGTCTAFNFQKETKLCELMEVAEKLVIMPGWGAYRSLGEIPARLLDPCASGPCRADQVCVQYWPPSYLPLSLMASLNYSLPGYTCSSHPWLISQRSEGKTSCVYQTVMYHNLDSPDLYTKVGAPFYRGFELCEEYNCLSMSCLFSIGGAQKIFLKADSPLTGGTLELNLVVISWYPTCT